MAVITPSRGDLFLPLHDLHSVQAHNLSLTLSHSLLPSAMPAPPPSASPRVPSRPGGGVGPFPLPAKLEKNKLEVMSRDQSPYDVLSWKKEVDVEVPKEGGWDRERDRDRERGPLGSIDTNTHVTAAAHNTQPPIKPNGQGQGQTRSHSTSHSARPSTASASTSHQALITRQRQRQQSNNPSGSIPRPAPLPDVFAPAPSPSLTTSTSKRSRPSLLSLNANSNTNTTGTHPHPAPGKRPRDKDNARDQLGIGTGGGGASSKRAKVEEVRMVEEERWRAKWIKVFPTLVFHFEIGTEESGKGLKGRVLKMGAKIDQFFSTRVTHLIVRGNASPQKPKPLAPRRGDPARESPKNPFLDGMGTTDLAMKAEAMGMKVWTVKKLSDMLAKIAPVEVINDSLHTLLEDERLHGTRERDLSAPRPDYYYFKPGSKYLLIEDATGKHKPIMVKEYSTKDVEYPVLFDGFLRVSSSVACNVPIDKIRARAIRLYVDRKSFEGEAPPGELRRSTSLRSFPGTPKLAAPAAPYQNASGNSVVITSNIASTSNANPSPAFPTLGKGTLAQMSKRVQVLKGNARLRGGDMQMPLRRATVGGANGLSGIGSGSGSGSGSGGLGKVDSGLANKTFMSQAQVVRMLMSAREPVFEPTVTDEQRRENRAKVDAGLKGKDQDTAPGYCENCRLRYSDLSVHIASKKHRRFAENPDNFHELDTLLMELRRPPHPALQEDVHKLFPACHEKHGAWSDCQLCQPRYGWEEESGSGSGSEEGTGTGTGTGTGSEHGEESEGSEGSEGSELCGSGSGSERGSGTSEEGSDDDEE